MAETVGDIQVVARINTKEYDAGKKSIEKGNNDLEKGAEKTSNSFSAAWTGAIAGVAAALTNKFLGAITSSIDGAVRRVDTLNNSARTFQNMGINAVDSASAMQALEKSIKGLPTPLDAAVAGMTALTATYGDIGKGQKVFSALNNAILGFGGTSDMVNNAITQLSQLPLDGPLDAQTWNSLRNSGITPVLAAMAKDSGISVSKLKENFGDGTLSVQDFIDKLLKLNTEGGGGLVSLEQIAKDSTKGIGTGFANLQTAVVRGVASIIQTVGSENISNAITGIADAFTTVLKGISGVIEYLKTNQGVFKTLVTTIGTGVVVFTAYTTVVRVAAATTAAYTVISSYLTLVQALQAQGLGVLRASWLALNIAMNANPIGIIIALVAALVAGLAYFFTQTETGRKTVEVAFDGIKKSFTDTLSVATQVAGSLARPFANAWNGIRAIFSGAAPFFQSVWNTIISIFGNIGVAIGNAIGASFKNIINGILRFAVGMINGFIDAINAAVDTINKIPGVSIGRIGRLPIPQLAKGGIVSSPTLAMIGEGRESEAVIPLSKLDAMLAGDNQKSSSSKTDITINLTGVMASSRNDLRAVGKNIIESVNEELRAKQLPEIGGGALRSTV